MRRTLLACLCAALAGGCREDKQPAGQEIARLDSIPVVMQRAGDTLIVQTSDPNDNLDVKLPKLHSLLFAVPIQGGPPKQFARLPRGEFRVGPKGIAYVTKREAQVAVVDLAGGVRWIASAGHEASAPVWVDDGIVVLAQDERVEHRLVRVALNDGTVTPVVQVYGGTSVGFAVADSQGSFLATQHTGATFRITPSGDAVPMLGPTGVLSCFALTSTHLWWASWPSRGPKLLLIAEGRKGGIAETVVELREEGGIGCAAGSNELFYTAGTKIMAVAVGGKPRVVVSSKMDVQRLLVDADFVYWVESAPGTEWSIRRAPIR